MSDPVECQYYLKSNIAVSAILWLHIQRYFPLSMEDDSKTTNSTQTSSYLVSHGCNKTLPKQLHEESLL